jgi:glycosyltransferase involved in cell wall biosynthesis
MTNILFTSWYTGLGGGETDLLSLAAGLADRYTPHLLVPAEGALAQHWREQGWTAHILPYRGASTWFIPAIWARFPVVERMRKLLQEQQIDLVSSEYHTLPLIAAAAQRAGIPIMWTVHGWWFRPKWWQRRYLAAFPAVARSYSIRAGFLGEPPFMPADQLPVVYSGVDTGRFHPAADGAALRTELGLGADTALVGMVARFQPVKGQHTFQEMARRILATMPDVHFVVAGEEPFGVSKDQAYRQRLLENAQNDPLLRERLHYIGFRRDVERVLAACDVVVCASQFESYGKVNIEAMACGRAVVSTRRGGPSETVLDGVTGLLVEPDQPDALAEKVMALLRDGAWRTQMGKAGRERVEALFSADQAARQYEEVFEHLLD